MNMNDKVKIILDEIEYYLCFDRLQREYAEKAIIKALREIRRREGEEMQEMKKER